MNKDLLNILSNSNKDIDNQQLMDYLNGKLRSEERRVGKEQKLCVILFYLEKKSYQEIAGSTGFSLMQVKSHIQNGKRNLKLLIGKKAGMVVKSNSK